VPGIDTGGVVTVIWVSETTVKELNAMLPKLTTVAPVKLVPVTVTTAPPAITPRLGLTDVTVGWVTKGSCSGRKMRENVPLSTVRFVGAPGGWATW